MEPTETASAGPAVFDDAVALGVLNTLQEGAEKDRADWAKKGKECEELAYGEGYEDLYNQIQDLEFIWKAKINRASEGVEIFGPYLFPENPGVTIGTRGPTNVWNEARHEVEKLYLDYALEAGNLASEGRRAVNHGLLHGRVQIWTGFNPRRDIVAQQFVPTTEIFLDPDAKSYDELNWIMRRREKPKWELALMHPEKSEQIMTAESSAVRKSGTTDTQAELIEYFEAYFRVGLHHYSSKMVPTDGKADDTPLVYCFMKKAVLSSKPWPIPFHKIDAWPLEMIDLRSSRSDSIHPEGVFFSGIPHLKALCWIYTLYLNRCRLATRTAFMAANYNGQGLKDEDIIKLLHGSEFDVVRVKVNGNELKLSDLLQQINIETRMEELERFVALVGSEWEKSTGLDAMLYSGATRTQLRIAADVDLKKSQSMHRVEDMKTQMADGMKRLARKTLFAARFLHDSEDIAKRWGKDAAAVWGELAPTETVEMEKQYREQTKQMFMQQAQMAAQQQAAMQSQMPQDPAMPPMPPPPPPTPEELEKQLGPPMYISMDEWVEEFDCTIEVSSMRRVDFEAQMANAETILTQLAPIIAPAPGGMSFIAAAIEEFAELSKFSPKLRAAAAAFKGVSDMPPPPPMASPAPGGDKEKPPQDNGRPNHGVIAKG